MTMFSTARFGVRDWHIRGHIIPIVLASAIAAGAIALVAYLLWPTWSADGTSAPERLPVSIGGTLFNVPAAAIRVKIQRHSGPQERIDLNFSFPSLAVPEAPKHLSADNAEDAIQPIDRIFLSIAAHHDEQAPETRVRTIYPRYLDQTSIPSTSIPGTSIPSTSTPSTSTPSTSTPSTSTPSTSTPSTSASSQDGLTVRAFRQGTPYGGEDLISAAAPSLTARCSRDAATPGMCLSERRIGGADLTFRFPRNWLAQWRDVTEAMDRLTLQLHGAK
jgi:hypothetical protein